MHCELNRSSTMIHAQSWQGGSWPTVVGSLHGDKRSCVQVRDGVLVAQPPPQTVRSSLHTHINAQHSTKAARCGFRQRRDMSGGGVDASGFPCSPKHAAVGAGAGAGGGSIAQARVRVQLTERPFHNVVHAAAGACAWHGAVQLTWVDKRRWWWWWQRCVWWRRIGVTHPLCIHQRPHECQRRGG